MSARLLLARMEHLAQILAISENLPEWLLLQLAFLHAGARQGGITLFVKQISTSAKVAHAKMQESARSLR